MLNMDVETKDLIWIKIENHNLFAFALMIVV
jgi:hypothetical protein